MLLYSALCSSSKLTYNFIMLIYRRKGRKKYRCIVGVDEVGRGPIAGPVAVGAIVLLPPFRSSPFKGVKDSKKLTQKEREMWFEKINIAKIRGELDYCISTTAPHRIDVMGIMPATRDALRRALSRLDIVPRQALILLDGGLQAPKKFHYQETIIRGDESELAITLASIVAKVKRDRKMIRLGELYPHFAFEAHKGYGTKEHYRQIKKHGLCILHRRSFLTKLTI